MWEIRDNEWQQKYEHTCTISIEPQIQLKNKTSKQK